jgi:hypothetical protein
VNLSGWSLHDGSGRDQDDFPSGTPWIAGSGYLLLASDSLIYGIFPALRDSSNVVLAGTTGFSLNLDGDDVVLRASDNATIDSIRYRPDWHRKGLDDTKGISLERISPGGPGNDSRNWSSSVNPAGGTPDGMNSVAIPVTVGQATLSVDPSTVSPDADGFEDFVRVSYHLPARSSRIVVTVYDRSGRHVRRLASNDLSGPEGELIWDGRDDEAAPLAPGIYVVWLEAYDEGGAGLMNARATVIVARKL